MAVISHASQPPQASPHVAPFILSLLWPTRQETQETRRYEFMSKDVIANFLAQMRQDYADDIAAIELPEGTRDYVIECAHNEDAETLMFMLKLAYLMGLQTGYAASQSEHGSSSPPKNNGPLKA